LAAGQLEIEHGGSQLTLKKHKLLKLLFVRGVDEPLQPGAHRCRCCSVVRSHVWRDHFPVPEAGLLLQRNQQPGERVDRVGRDGGLAVADPGLPGKRVFRILREVCLDY
jgi:hypothetical protein